MLYILREEPIGGQLGRNVDDEWLPHYEGQVPDDQEREAYVDEAAESNPDQIEGVSNDEPELDASLIQHVISRQVGCKEHQKGEDIDEVDYLAAEVVELSEFGL